jgi:hypothetical protein
MLNQGRPRHWATPFSRATGDFQGNERAAAESSAAASLLPAMGCSLGSSRFDSARGLIRLFDKSLVLRFARRKFYEVGEEKNPDLRSLSEPSQFVLETSTNARRPTSPKHMGEAHSHPDLC